MDLNTIKALTAEGLRQRLTELGLETTGRKVDLQNRLIEHFQLSRQDEGDNSEDESEYNDVASVINPSVSVQRSHFTLKDIEESLSNFSGDGYPEIDQWICEFEDNAMTVEWNNLQKFVYGQQLLKGAAKAYLKSQSGIKNWDTLKNALIDEFGTKLSSIEIHRLLAKRNKKSNESFREYLYSLMEIAKPIKLDDESLIEYFINGIADSRQNKSVLFQARNIEDLKVQMKTYEKIRFAGVGKPQQSLNLRGEQKPFEKNFEPKKLDQKRCFKCGDTGHFSNNCSSKQYKCFKCNSFGHKSFECTANKIVRVKDENLINRSSNSCIVKACSERFVFNNNEFRNFKNIEFKNILVPAIIDTGSDICILRHDVYKTLKNISFVKEEKEFITASTYVMITLGHFEENVLIDGMQFYLKFYVTKSFPYPAAIGNNILKKVDIVLGTNSVKFIERKKAELSDLELWNEFGKEVEGCLAISEKEVKDFKNLSDNPTSR